MFRIVLEKTPAGAWSAVVPSYPIARKRIELTRDEARRSAKIEVLERLLDAVSRGEDLPREVDTFLFT